MATTASEQLELQGRLRCLPGAEYLKQGDECGSPRVELFVGNVDGSVSSSWCPDCERAVPVVLAAALNAGWSVVGVGVGERDDWKLDARGASNPFRASDGRALTGVPTARLVYGTGEELGRLGPELEEQDVDKIADAVKGLLESNAVALVTAGLEGRLRRLSAAEYLALPAAESIRLEIFTGNTDGNTAKSWCPDCKRSVPVVLEAASETKVPIFVVGVGERDDWKLDARGASNPFRAEDGLHLTGVPTARLVDTSGELARVGPELEDQDVGKARAAVQAVLKQLTGA